MLFRGRKTTRAKANGIATSIKNNIDDDDNDDEFPSWSSKSKDKTIMPTLRSLYLARIKQQHHTNYYRTITILLGFTFFVLVVVSNNFVHHNIHDNKKENVVVEVIKEETVIQPLVATSIHNVTPAREGLRGIQRTISQNTTTHNENNNNYISTAAAAYGTKIMMIDGDEKTTTVKTKETSISKSNDYVTGTATVSSIFDCDHPTNSLCNYFYPFHFFFGYNDNTNNMNGIGIEFVHLLTDMKNKKKNGTLWDTGGTPGVGFKTATINNLCYYEHKSNNNNNNNIQPTETPTEAITTYFPTRLEGDKDYETTANVSDVPTVTPITFLPTRLFEENEEEDEDSKIILTNIGERYYNDTNNSFPDNSNNNTNNKRRCITERISFIHVHKTGGSSISSALQRLQNTHSEQVIVQKHQHFIPLSKWDTNNIKTLNQLEPLEKRAMKSLLHATKYPTTSSMSTVMSTNNTTTTTIRQQQQQQQPPHFHPTQHVLFAVVRDPIERFISSIGQAMIAKNSSTARTLRRACMYTGKGDTGNDIQTSLPGSREEAIQAIKRRRKRNSTPMNMNTNNMDMNLSNRTHTYPPNIHNATTSNISLLSTSSSSASLSSLSHTSSRTISTTSKDVLTCFAKYVRDHGFWIELHFTPQVLDIAFATFFQDVPLAIFEMKKKKQEEKKGKQRQDTAITNSTTTIDGLNTILSYLLQYNDTATTPTNNITFTTTTNNTTHTKITDTKKTIPHVRDGSNVRYRSSPLLTNMSIHDYDDETIQIVCTIYKMDVIMMRSLQISVPYCDPYV